MYCNGQRSGERDTRKVEPLDHPGFFLNHWRGSSGPKGEKALGAGRVNHGNTHPVFEVCFGFHLFGDEFFLNFDFLPRLFES